MKSKSVVETLGRSAVSILLSVCMIAFLLPLNVWAEEIRSEEILDGDDSAAAIVEPEEEKEVIVEEEIETSRDAFTKELVKGSGAHFYAVFPLAVHYEEDSGEDEKTWKEIDNTLQKTEEGYANTAGAWEVALPEDPSAEPVSVTYNGHTLRYSLTDLHSSSSEVLDVSLDPEEGSLQAQTIPKGFASAIEYPEAVPEGTLRYDLVSHQLKESVVFNALPETRELTYVLTGEDLSVELNEDNTLSVSFGGELAFIWEAPYLYDADGFPCFDVQTTVTATEEGYSVTCSLPEEWLSSEERVFPVTFDPVVHPDILISNTQDQTVFTNKTEPYTWGMVECGRYSGYGVSRCYIQYNTLPTLTSADVITRAEMSLYKLQQSTEQAQINVHKVLGSWNHTTLNWSNKPAYDPLVEDYRLIYNKGWYTWLITDIARSWYTEGNHGMMFKASDAIEGSTSDNWKQFCSSNYGGTVMPVLYLTFINNCGIESSWEYEETGAGRAGTGYVSDFTGNLVWVRDEMGFDGQRMPVTVERIYNANDKDDNRFGMGYGWRTNFNQLVYQWSTDSSYYVWEDEDGTRQYFKYKSSGTYEDERGTGLILTTTGSGNSKYTITDRQNNKRTFDTNGRLYQIRNNQATVSTITVAYTTTSGKLIDTVTDGAGRIYKFTYSSSLLTNLTFKGSNSGSYYSVNYNYSSYRFMGATYPDGKTISYTYNGSRLLTTATDVDGYKVTYGYSSTAPYRVTSIAVSDDGTQGGTLSFSYAHNETTITDHNLNREILQFTDWGNTVCVQDDEGRAVYAEYAEKDTNGDRKKADQMTLDSKLQDTVVNKLASGSFEFGSRWTGASGNPSTGSWTVSTEQHYIGQKSMKITSSSTTPFMVTPTNALSLTVGKTYTLSAYVLAGNAGAQLRVYTGSTLTAQTDPIASGSSWQRVQVTFTCTNATNTKVYLVNAASGTVYFDCVQLEQSTSAGRYNMIENGDMHYTDSGYTSNAYGWTSTTPALTWGHRETLNESAGALMDSAVYRIYGQADTYVQCHQQVNQGGSAGDCYVFAGWAKGDSVAMGTGRVAKICLILKFRYTDGTDENIRMNFNPDADSTDHWQYGAGRAIAKKDYSAVQVFMCFDYNANTAYFDGIQLFKEEFGNSYVYDSEGRITSVTDLQKQVTSYEYSNNDLVKAVTKEGNTEKAKVTYTYDSYHNVLKATTLEGVETSFTYDNYGNNIKVERGSVNAQATFTNSGNTLSTVRDTQGNTTTYGYNAQTGVLTYVQRPGENSSTRTNYTYDSLWRNTSVSKQSTSNSYVYTDDLLSSLVNGSGTTYTFNNGVFGQTNTVKIGTRTLVTNTYSSDRNRYLTKSTYGNGNYISYTYDSHGRTTKVGYEDNANAILYEFDSEGRLGLVKDNLSGRTRKLLYDLSGRSVGYTEKGTNHTLDVTYGYDGLNNVSTRTEKLNGTTYTSSYTYDRDSRVTAVSNGTPKAANTYDSLSRLTKVLSKNNSSTVITTNIGYSSALVNSWSNVSGGVTDTYSYTYDSHGNITAITSGGNTTQYIYDGFDQLTRENNQAANKTWVYTYDNGGNILTKKEYAYTTGTVGTALSSKTFTYGDGSWKDLLTKIGTTTVTTDTIGNMTSDGEWTYTWKHGRQLSGMSKTGHTLSFSYDADGLRTKKEHNGTVTYYYYIGSQLTDVTQGNNTLHIDYDSVGPASVKFNGTYFWYLRNAQGDVTGIVDSSGTRVVTYTYDAWGNPLSQSTAGSTWNDLADLNPLRYRGYVYDSETGLYYLQSRYYDPEICRFINADGYASTGQGLLGGNAFAYCGNNPTIRVDILGYEWKVVGAGIQLTISGSIGGTSVEIGFEVIIYWDTDEVSDAGHAVVAVYLYGGSSFDAPNILNDVLGLTGLLMDSVENLTKNTGKELSSVLDTWNPSLSLSVSASAVLILGNEKFTSCLSYEHEFKNCSISIAGIKGSFAFSDCCRAISLGVVKTIGAPQKCVSLGKSYYVCLWSTEKGFLPGVRRYEK